MSWGARKCFAILPVLLLLALMLLIPSPALALEAQDSLDSVSPVVVCGADAATPTSSDDTSDDFDLADSDEDMPELTGQDSFQGDFISLAAQNEEQTIVATPIFNPSYTEVTDAAIASFTEDDWEERLGLPQQVTVNYKDGGTAGPAVSYPASGIWGIVGWMTEDGVPLSLSVLEAKASQQTTPQQAIGLSPLYAVHGEHARPDWARATDVRYTLIIRRLSAPGSAQASSSSQLPSASGTSATPVSTRRPHDGSAQSYALSQAQETLERGEVAFAEAVDQEDAANAVSESNEKRPSASSEKTSVTASKPAKTATQMNGDPLASTVALIVMIVALILLLLMKWNSPVLTRVRKFLFSSHRK